MSSRKLQVVINLLAVGLGVLGAEPAEAGIIFDPSSHVVTLSQSASIENSTTETHWPYNYQYNGDNYDYIRTYGFAGTVSDSLGVYAETYGSSNVYAGSDYLSGYSHAYAYATSYEGNQSPLIYGPIQSTLSSYLTFQVDTYSAYSLDLGAYTGDNTGGESSSPVFYLGQINGGQSTYTPISIGNTQGFFTPGVNYFIPHVTSGNLSPGQFDPGTEIYQWGEVNYSLNVTPSATAIPEPSTWAMMGMSLVALAFIARRKHDMEGLGVSNSMSNSNKQ